jgi:hypothetical protein
LIPRTQARPGAPEGHIEPRQRQHGGGRKETRKEHQEQQPPRVVQTDTRKSIDEFEIPDLKRAHWISHPIAIGHESQRRDGEWQSNQWHQKAQNCTVCSKPEVILSMLNPAVYTLSQLISDSRLNLKKPSSVYKHGSGYIYSEKKAETHVNLARTLSEMRVSDGEELLVLDSSVHVLPITVIVHFSTTLNS